MKINVRLVIEVDNGAWRLYRDPYASADSVPSWPSATDEEIRQYISSVVVDAAIEAFDDMDAVQVVGEAVS